MRVIAGKARRLPLKTIPGMDTRPTTDRIKETLFNILQNDIEDCVFLDLFSGSGGIGIEALSRGARHAYFVDQSPACTKCIRENLQFTKLEDCSTVMECSVMSALLRLEKQQVRADIIFMDPPYDQGMEREVMEYLQNSALLQEDTLIIIETSLRSDESYFEVYGFHVLRSKQYKTNKHIFIMKAEDVDCENGRNV